MVALTTSFSGKGGYASLTGQTHLKFIIAKTDKRRERTCSVSKVLSRRTTMQPIRLACKYMNRGRINC